MDNSLSNSFYYFYSTVPQVLGAVLALFGVFLIYKIQALKEELVAKATDILVYLNESKEHDTLGDDEYTKFIRLTGNSLSIWLPYKNVGTFYNIICKFGHSNIGKVDNMYATYSHQYGRMYKLHRGLIQATRYFSVISIITIIGCLSIIPYAKYFLSKPDILEGIFFITILCVALCFVGLLLILYFTLSDKSELPHLDATDFILKKQ